MSPSEGCCRRVLAHGTGPEILDPNIIHRIVAQHGPRDPGVFPENHLRRAVPSPVEGTVLA
eukprot:5340182-Pyramimonas_sp.AAC.1